MRELSRHSHSLAVSQGLWGGWVMPSALGWTSGFRWEFPPDEGFGLESCGWRSRCLQLALLSRGLWLQKECHLVPAWDTARNRPVSGDPQLLRICESSIAGTPGRRMLLLARVPGESVSNQPHITARLSRTIETPRTCEYEASVHGHLPRGRGMDIPKSTSPTGPSQPKMPC